jgi:putative holliday junction resolvase
MARILALDVGEKRIGVAVSDAMNIIARGLETIERKSSEDDTRRIQSLIEDHDIAKIVVGMPINMNGTKGPSADTVEIFAGLLREKLNITVETVDERLTTVQGERILLESNVSRKKRKAAIDRLSARLILQVYLDSKF